MKAKINTRAAMRTLSLLLALLILGSCNQSAGQVTADSTAAETTAAPETEAPKPTDGLEDVDMDGYELNIIAGLTFWTKSQYIAENDGEPVNDAIYKRNLALEERFKCKISAFQEDLADHREYLQLAMKDVKSGDGEYNMVSVYDTYITSLLPYISDWNNLPHLSLNEPWWNPDATEVYNWGGKQLALNGYTGISAASCSNCIVFNKDMLESLNQDQNDLYSSVKAGTWTLDRMYEYGKMAVQDINGDGNYDENDRYGIHDASSTKTFVNAAVASAGIRYIEYNENHDPVYTFDKESSVSMLQTFIDKTVSSGIYHSNVTNADQATEPAYFEINRALFAHTSLLQVEQYRTIENFEIGILPFPKFDDNVENYRSLSVGSCASFLPRTVQPEEYENLGTLIEAMAFYTYHEVLPVYKEIALKTKAARDNESAEMLDIVFNTICFDMAHSLETLVTKPLINATFIKKDSGSVASTIEKNKSKIQKEIDKMVAEAAEIE